MPTLAIGNNDLLHLGLLAGAILLFLLLAEYLRKRFSLSDEVTRKTVHIATGVLIFFAPPFFPRAGAVALIAAAFVLLNMLAYFKGWLASVHHSARRSHGTVYYPLALLLLAVPLWERYPDLVVASILVMALGDAAAGITGESIARPVRYRVTSDEKSLQGSIAMLGGTVLALLLTTLVYPDGGLQLGHAFNHDPLLFAAALLAVALFATGWEAASSRGLDNLTVPLFTAFALYLSFAGHDPAGARFAQGVALGGGVALLSLRLRLLTVSGAVATALLAAVIFGSGGWAWTLPIFLFFLLSSFLSKWRRRAKQRFDTVFEKGGTRDAGQVAANGALAGALAVAGVIFGMAEFYHLYLVAIAVVTADTWGTELGILSRRTPRHVLTWKHVPAGSSGGVTMLGSLGGALGACVVTASALPFEPLPALTFSGIVVAGVAGSIFDSALGATLQAQYRCAQCGQNTEKTLHCDTATRQLSGWRWMNNDAVNLLSTALAVAMAAVLLAAW